MKNAKEILEIIKTLEKNYDFSDCIENYIDIEELEACESVYDVIELVRNTNESYELTNTEVIYYAKAIEYLARVDQSLAESMEIAHEYGYTTENINSELLASLHKSRANQEDFETLLNELEKQLED